MSVIQQYVPTTALQQQYQKFWQKFNRISASSEEFCKEFTPHQHPSIRPYQDYSIGRKYHINTGIEFSKGVIRVKAYFRNLADYLEVYRQSKDRIEAQLGRTLRWQAFKTKRAITLYAAVSLNGSDDWQEASKVMMENMILMKNVVE